MSSGRPASSASSASASSEPHGRAAAHVERRPRGAAGLEGGPDGGDDVADVGEVARLPAVSEHGDGRAAAGGGAEARERHVRALARAVDGEEPEDDRVRAARPDGRLGGGLRRGVGRGRGERRRLGCRERRGIPVDRGRGRMHEAHARRARHRGGQARGRVHVAPCVQRGARAERRPHARLAREVHDGVAAADERREVERRQVAGDEREAPLRARRREVAQLARRVVVARQRVDAAHRVPIGQQRVAHVRSDEAGAAGDEHAHGPASNQRRPAGPPPAGTPVRAIRGTRARSCGRCGRSVGDDAVGPAAAVDPVAEAVAGEDAVVAALAAVDAVACRRPASIRSSPECRRADPVLAATADRACRRRSRRRRSRCPQSPLMRSFALAAAQRRRRRPGR